MNDVAKVDAFIMVILSVEFYIKLAQINRATQSCNKKAERKNETFLSCNFFYFPNLKANLMSVWLIAAGSVVPVGKYILAKFSFAV